MLPRLYAICRQSNSSFVMVLVRTLYYSLIGKKIIAHELTEINGVSRIKTNSFLKIGVNHVGFVSSKDRTLLNIQGALITYKGVQIGRGCRFDIGLNATVSIGERSSINPFTKVIIMNGLTIGNDCAISWECQFLDDDFHQIHFEGKKASVSKHIIIGNHVWIGSQVNVYKGSFIANGCIVAANSVVKGIFTEENTLIAGNPAQVVKRNVNWS